MANFYILSAIFIWSSLGVIVRLAGTSLTNTIFFPALVAFIAQTAIVASTNEIRHVPPLRKVPYLMLLGPVLIMNHLLFFYAFTHTTIANAVLTHYTAPIFVAFLSPLILKEQVHRKVYYAIVISSAGLFFLLRGFSISADHLTGIAAGTASGLTYAFIIIIGRYVATHFRVLIVTVFQNLTMVFILLPFVGPLNGNSVFYLVIMGLLHSTLAPLLYIRGLRDVEAGKASVLGYLEPVGAMFFAFLFFSEVPGWSSLIGGAMIILSGYIIIKKDSRQSNENSGHPQP